MNIKTNDTVIVLSGKDKGKKGKILESMPTVGKVLVEGVNVAAHHVKPRKQGQEGGIIRKETPIRACKVRWDQEPRLQKVRRDAVRRCDGWLD